MSFAQKRGISLKEVLQNYTAKELDLWRAWESREITELAKIEHVLAQLTSAFMNVHRQKGKKPIELTDIVYRADWRTAKQADSQTIIKEFLSGLS